MLLVWVNKFSDSLYHTLTGNSLPQAHRRDGELLLCLLGITILAFGFELTNPTLGIDDYAHLVMPFDWDPFWISRGMWGGLLLQYLQPGGWITPFISLFIGLGLQCIAAIMIGWLLQAHNLGYGERLLSLALFTTFPFFAAQMAFSYLHIGYPLATSLSIAALILAQSDTAWRWVAGSILIAFAISIYQGCISVLITAAALYPLQLYLQKPSGADHAILGRKQITVFARMCGVILAGAAIYYLLHKTILYFAGLPPGDGYYSVSFDLAFWHRWASILHHSGYLLMGSEGLVPHLAQLGFLLTLFYVACRLAAALPWWQSIVLLPLAAVLAFSPFSILFLHEGELAPRSSLGVSLLWLAVFIMAHQLTHGRVARRNVSICAALVLVIFAFQNNRMFYSDLLVEQAEMLSVNRMEERIVMLDAENGAQPIKGIVVLGAYSYPTTPATVRYCDSVLGYSMFEWGTETPHYAVATLARVRGIAQFMSYGPEVLGGSDSAQALVANRNPWPHPDAVFLQDDYAVLWLGTRNNDCGEGSLLDWLARQLPL